MTRTFRWFDFKILVIGFAIYHSSHLNHLIRYTKIALISFLHIPILPTICTITLINIIFNRQYPHWIITMWTSYSLWNFFKSHLNHLNKIHENDAMLFKLDTPSNFCKLFFFHHFHLGFVCELRNNNLLWLKLMYHNLNK